MDNAPMNEQMDARVSKLLERAKVKLIENGICSPEQAEECLIVRLIEAVTTMIFGTCRYMPEDDRMGVYIFLSKLGDQEYRSWSNNCQNQCAIQLMNHRHVYFPKYHAILGLVFRRVLDSTYGHEFGFADEAILRLAAASLPGARSELQCRGGELYKRVLR